MNKTELIAAVAEKADLSKKDAEAAITAAVEAITGALIEGEKVQLVGFGSFEVKTRAARVGRNPKTGEGGAENVVEVEPGRIRIVSATCPDQVCVRQGWISDSTVPVVCLPNQVIVEIVGGEGFVDTAAG